MFILNKHKNKVISINFVLVLCLTVLTASTISTPVSADVATESKKADSLSISNCNEAPSRWAWMSGEKTVLENGVYGTKGVPDITNHPGARFSSVSWTDKDGNFWLFGGYGHAESGGQGWFDDLWKFGCFGECAQIPSTDDDDGKPKDDLSLILTLTIFISIIAALFVLTVIVIKKR